MITTSLSRGVITRALPNADTLAFSPPFVIDKHEIDTLVTTVREAVDSVQHELQADGLWQP